MAKALEYIFVHYHIPPDEVMQKSKGTRAFMFAAAMNDIENGYTSMKCPFMKS